MGLLNKPSWADKAVLAGSSVMVVVDDDQLRTRSPAPKYQIHYSLVTREGVAVGFD
jgi:hypothetical protein